MVDHSRVLNIEATPRERRHEVLRFMQLGDARRERLLEAADVGEIDMQGLFHARRGDAIVGAAWGQTTSGRLGFCWPATTEAGEPERTAELLLSAVNRYLDLAGILVVQSLISLRDVLSAMRLVRAGYSHLADLDYLVSARAQFPTQRSSSALSFLSGWRGDEQRLKQLIALTYSDTLDCTRLDGTRSLDEVLAGYRETGVCRPEWWVIARYRGEDVGCVLMADHPEHDQCELMYLGVTPWHRGKGWGTQLVRHAQWLAFEGRRQQIVLGVDDANWPARDLYQRQRFEVWDRRSVYVRTACTRGARGPSCSSARG